MLRQFLGFAGARVLAALFQAAALLFVARFYAPSEFARFAAVLGALQFLQLVIDAGSSTAIMKYYEYAKASRAIVVFTTILGVVVSFVSLLGLYILSVSTSSDIYSKMIPLSIWLMVERQCELRGALALARGRVLTPSSMLVLRRALPPAAILVAGSDLDPITVYSWSTLASSILASAVLTFTTRLVRELRPTRLITSARDGLVILLPYGSAVVGQNLRQLDVTVVSLFAGSSVAANYAPASRLLPPFLLIPGTYSQILLGRLTRERRAIRVSDALAPLGVSVVGYGFLALSVPLWLTPLLGDAYAGSEAPLSILFVGMIFATWRAVCATGLQAANRPGKVSVVSWVGGATTLLGAALLGVLAGAVGASLATTASLAVQAIVLQKYVSSSDNPLQYVGRKANSGPI